MFQHGRNLGKSLPMSDTHFVLSEEEKKQFASYPKSDFFGEAKDQATDPTEHERDTQNDGGYNENTGVESTLETVQKQAKEMVDFIKEATNIRHIEFNDSKALTVEQVKELWK